MSIPLDAREILSHLNQLGYRHITPEQLKEFQKDLRKLIKFDTRISGGGCGATVDQEALAQAAQQMNTFQRLHTLTTISYNAKVARKGSSHVTAQSTTAAAESKRDDHHRPEVVTPVEQHHDGKENQMTTAVVGGGKSKSKKLKADKDNPAANKMWIRPRSTSANSFRKNDPVSLYHAYQKEWTRFKNQLPGENDHSDLRWQIRTKLLADRKSAH
ncbi:uncharacterized protein LOC109429910 [Aedes albopictus]|uniref:Centriolar and ciliogenesis-associated protein HYLS1 C-terminal domain-containing protein n=1 Tax=Aedes albopictus TaxID=7160 RepID=A0ABM1Z139_AEDAL